jgi:hypothetical protein
MLRPYISPITTLDLAMCLSIQTVCQRSSFLKTSSFDKLRTNVYFNIRFYNATFGSSVGSPARRTRPECQS